MLNTLPSPALHPRLPPAIPPLRRGGQPANHYTRTHGLFACKNPTALTHLSNAHALDLIRWNFRSSGVVRDADSFREKNKKSDFNSFLLFMQPGWQVFRRIPREEPA